MLGAGGPLTLAAIRTYRYALSPIVERVAGPCRFAPTCSRYAEAVIERDGLWRGALRAAGRVMRCGPWTPRGTVDEP